MRKRRLDSVSESRAVIDDLATSPDLLVGSIEVKGEANTAKNVEGLASEGGVETLAVQRSIVLVVGERSKDTSDTTEHDDDDRGERLLTLSSDVVLREVEHERDVGVGTPDTDEGTSELDVALLGGEEHTETSDGEEALSDEDGHADKETIGNDGGSKGTDHGNTVRSRSKKERVFDGIAKSAQDDGQEVGKCVGRHGCAHEHETVEPDLDVGSVLGSLSPGESIVLRVSTVALDTRQNHVALGNSEESLLGSLVREVKDQEVGSKSKQNSGHAFQDEDPAPTPERLIGHLDEGHAVGENVGEARDTD